MALLAIPNISEGRDQGLVGSFAAVVEDAGPRVLDVHMDAVHNRSVFTVTGPPEHLVEAMTALAEACRAIDLTRHVGAHPRVGALDVCPFVPHGSSLADAVTAAHETGRRIGKIGLPVYYYGAAATRAETRELPSLRRGGLGALIQRAAGGFAPDEGPAAIDPRSGIVCVGAREALIAFNVLLRCGVERARDIAREIRDDRRLAGVRAIGIAIDDGTAQVSMNLTKPDEVGIDAAFQAVASAAVERSLEIVATEIVGLVPERYLPSPQKEAARLLIEPGRSVEEALYA